jgi:hypothetical protein
MSGITENLDSSRLRLFGTLQDPLTFLQATAGELSAECEGPGLCNVRWGGIDLIRSVQCLVRDASWRTCPVRLLDRALAIHPHQFELSIHQDIGDGALSCMLVFEGRASGYLAATMELTAHRDFSINRAGFVVLHPIAVAGSALIIDHSDGSRERTCFPASISAAQVVFDIAQMQYSAAGATVNIQFRGDRFEMEDQRNWSDASYKTYCRPLSLPVPYLLKAGGVYHQTIEIKLAGYPENRNSLPCSLGFSLEGTHESIPKMGLALDLAGLPSDGTMDMVLKAGVGVVQLRVDSDCYGWDALFRAASEMSAHGAEVDLEVVIPQDHDADRWLEHVAQRGREVCLTVTRVIALPEPYLKSHQPTGPWPSGPAPRDVAIAARRHFRSTQIGSGVLTNFAEFNRCRPDLSVCDYVSHASSALVHAADDRSVIETLRGLSNIFSSARAISGDHDYRVGLVSIGMRSNPYGADVAPNPDQIRLTMARVDPRQRGLFAAAWAVGVVAATESHRVAALSLASPAGPFGLVYQPAKWRQPIYDDLDRPCVYPIFHVVRALTSMGGAPRLAVRGLPAGVVAVASGFAFEARLVISNLSGESRRFSLNRTVAIRILDEDSFEPAIVDPDWLRQANCEMSRQLKLAPYGVAFAQSPGLVW